MTHYYTAEEVKTLKVMYAEYYLIKEIAEKLGRSRGSVAWQIHHLGLSRNFRMINLVRLKGRDILKHGKDPAKVVAKIDAEQRKAKEHRQQALHIAQVHALDMLKADLKTFDRNTAITMAFMHGATQEQIGKVVGLSKQAVSLIVRKGRLDHDHKGKTRT